MSTLDPLFGPQAIAVLGASATPGKLGAAMTDSLASFPGPVMRVNAVRPNPELGFHRTVADAAKAYGITPDLVVSCIPAAVTADALREAAAAGARTALVCAGGFAEAGGDGVLYQQALTEVVRETGIRVLGPTPPASSYPTDGSPPVLCQAWQNWSLGRWRSWPPAEG